LPSLLRHLRLPSQETPSVLLTTINSLSEPQLLYDWRFTASQFILATSPLRLTTNNFFQLNTCVYSPYVTSSLTRGWVCRLQLLLVSTAQSFSGQSPTGLMTTF
jgi:hypothetical protein